MCAVAPPSCCRRSPRACTMAYTREMQRVAYPHTTSPAARPAAKARQATHSMPYRACSMRQHDPPAAHNRAATLAMQKEGVMHGTCHAGHGTMRANTLVDPRAQCLPSHCCFGVVLPAPAKTATYVNAELDKTRQDSAKLKRTGRHKRVSIARTFGRASDSSRASHRA